MNQNPLLRLALCFILLLSILPPTQAQKNKSNPAAIDEQLLDAMQWRSIGPYRGGRSAAVAGVPGKANLFYFGAAGGGVWKTTDGGRQWENISDGFFGGSIGAIAVSEFDPNVIYVGGGEVTVRGNVSSGFGMWKSVDAGKTWKAIGLKKSRHIARIRIHPRNPDLVYAAVLGNIYAPSEERGIYKSTDGGKNWKKVLFVNDEVGAIDLCLDPNNPRIMFASNWRVKRTPYSLSSGGAGSGIWKSTDGGENWTDISKNKGMPEGTLGISGITVSPVNSERVWAIIEAKEGGVFRSDDGGKTWQKTNSERKLRQRAWYYTRIYADPNDEDLVYVLNVRYHRSKDGGKTFSSFNSQHSDHHDLWIAPENSSRMIIADDGGAQISYDQGETWSTYYNQPTAQFYRVTTDNHFPFRIYVAQQDNSTVRISNRSNGSSITEDDWESTAGCECGHIAVDPLDNDIVYGGCYDGYLQRLDHKTKQRRAVSVWPDNPMGYGAEGMRYRFQWNFPIFFSPHNPKKLYAASNHLHVSYNEGQSWEIVSPDLTRNDPSKLGSSGGPITQDNTSVEYYCTIFAAMESPRVKDLLWVGSDDGLLHLSKDAGKNWENITPTKMPAWTMINSIEADPFNDGGCYVAATAYKLGDFKPYLYRTKDYGKTWTKITKGIDAEHFTRVVRADPDRQGLLYAGTEAGMYISFDDGNNWQAFQQNLPTVPITDLTIKDKTLVAATQGRSVWMLDELGILHQMKQDITQKDFHLFAPSLSYRMEGRQNKKAKGVGQNHPGGVNVHFYLKDIQDSSKVSLHFYDQKDQLIKSFATDAKEKKDKLTVEAGMNSFNWNMLYPEAKKFPKMILWWASMNGPRATPGTYKVELMVEGKMQRSSFEIKKDPRSSATAQDMQAQFDFISTIQQKITEAHETIISIRDIRAQLHHYQDRLRPDSTQKEIVVLAEQIDASLTEVEEALYQTKNESPQDPLNFPIRLTNKLAHLNSLMQGDYPPTDQAVAVRNELTKLIDVELKKYQMIIGEKLPQFNQMIRTRAVDAIILKGE